MLFQNGEQASKVLTVGMGNFVGTMGGTGATLVVPFLFMLFARSKQLKAVGKASFVPVIFAVNDSESLFLYSIFSRANRQCLDIQIFCGCS